MHEQRCARDPDHHRPEAIARGEGHRHQLTLIAKLRKEDHPRRKQERLHLSVRARSEREVRAI